MSARIATVTFSDTRTEADDEGGRTLRRLLEEAGFALGEHRIVREDVEAVRSALGELAASPEVDAVVSTGGTGLGPRDVTIEAVVPLFEKEMVGFGEAFRRLSWDQVGPRAMLSNATAGTRGGKLIVALPGSPKALDLAVKSLLAPILGHAIDLARGRTGHGQGRSK